MLLVLVVIIIAKAILKESKAPTAEKLMRSVILHMSGRKRVIWLQQHILLKGNSILKRISWHAARSNDWQKLKFK
jgi:hypothetical protein